MGGKNTLIFIFIAGCLICITSILNGMYDHQIRQKVTENRLYDHRWEMSLNASLSERLAISKPILKSDGNIDSIALQEHQYWNRIRDARDKKITAPYKLITSYNHYEIIDYGTAREIDSIKCIRYHEMVNKKTMYDNLDKACKEANKKEEEAQEIKEAELDRLNQSCN